MAGFSESAFTRKPSFFFFFFFFSRESILPVLVSLPASFSSPLVISIAESCTPVLFFAGILPSSCSTRLHTPAIEFKGIFVLAGRKQHSPAVHHDQQHFRSSETTFFDPLSPTLLSISRARLERMGVDSDNIPVASYSFDRDKIERFTAMFLDIHASREKKGRRRGPILSIETRCHLLFSVCRRRRATQLSSSSSWSSSPRYLWRGVAGGWKGVQGRSARVRTPRSVFAAR